MKIFRKIIYGWSHYPANICLFKVTNRHNRKKCEMCSKLTTKAPEWGQWYRSGVVLVNFQHVPHLFLVLLLFKQVNVSWVTICAKSSILYVWLGSKCAPIFLKTLKSHKFFFRIFFISGTPAERFGIKLTLPKIFTLSVT